MCVYISEDCSRDYDLSLSDILHQLVASNFVYFMELYDHINSEKVLFTLSELSALQNSSGRLKIYIVSF